MMPIIPQEILDRQQEVNKQLGMSGDRGAIIQSILDIISPATGPSGLASGMMEQPIKPSTSTGGIIASLLPLLALAGGMIIRTPQQRLNISRLRKGRSSSIPRDAMERIIQRQTRTEQELEDVENLPFLHRHNNQFAKSLGFEPGELPSGAFIDNGPVDVAHLFTRQAVSPDVIAEAFPETFGRDPDIKIFNRMAEKGLLRKEGRNFAFTPKGAKFAITSSVGPDLSSYSFMNKLERLAVQSGLRKSGE